MNEFLKYLLENLKPNQELRINKFSQDIGLELILEENNNGDQKIYQQVISDLKIQLSRFDIGCKTLEHMFNQLSLK